MCRDGAVTRVTSVKPVHRLHNVVFCHHYIWHSNGLGNEEAVNESAGIERVDGHKLGDLDSADAVALLHDSRVQI